MRKKILFCLFISFSAFYLQAQTDSTKKKDDDFDADEYSATEKIKAFCGPKVLDISPQKIFSVGYDYQVSHKLTTNTPTKDITTPLPPEQESSIGGIQGLRINFNYPVISKNNILLNVGGNYWRSNYTFSNPESLNAPLSQTLRNHGLTNAGLNFTLFKPINLKKFFIIQGGANLNGDYHTFNNIQSFEYMRYSFAFIYGFKPNDRLQWGIGVTRTYLGGALNYLPVIMYNHTFINRKWGVEALFPARVNLRRTINSQSLFLVGYEFEGQSYHLGNGGTNFPNNKIPELKRSEMRWRITYERSIKNFLWASIQVGYRVNYSFNVDDKDFFRSLFEKKPYWAENKLANPLYINISLNFVSP
jgi:hypothetical protein